MEKNDSKIEAVPSSLLEIRGFPYRTYRDLIASIDAGNCHLHLTFNPKLFSRLGPGAVECLQFTFFSIGFWAIPLIGVALSLFQSWWFLTLVLFAPIAFARSKNQYNRALINAIFRSEESFCFLYRFRQVSISTGDYRDGSFVQHYWGKEKESSIDYATLAERHKKVIELLGG